MKKFRSISLIETLISLTIVGLSIVALMPVMTVQKSSNDATKGNTKYWQMFHNNDVITHAQAANDGTNNITRVSPINNYSVSIGTASLPKDVVPANNNRNFIVSSSGELIPLYVDRFLNYKNESVFVTNNQAAGANANTSIHLAAGALSNDGACPGSAKNLYVDNNNVIIENIPNANINDDYVSGYNLCRSNNDNGLKYNFSGNDISGIYSIKNGAQNNEYLHVDVNRRIIGIGHNAVKFFKQNADAQDIIVIASFGPQLEIQPGDVGITDFSGLAIGYKDYSNASQMLSVEDNGNYVIFKSTLPLRYDGDPDEHVNDTAISINADLSVKNNNDVASSVQANAYLARSDIRLKNIVGKYAKGLKYILQLNPVEFTYKSDEKGERHIGVIAQDLQKIFPESVFKNNRTGYLSVGTDGIFYALLNSIKELNAKNLELKKQNDDLELKIAQLRKIRDDAKKQRGGQNVR